jgi:hypothetical protein
MSVFLELPPCLDENTLKAVNSSEVGYVSLSNEQTASAALSILAGDVFFWYWLVRGDGFHVTSRVISDFLSALNELPETEIRLLGNLGALINVRRYEALVFKKNAGKYVGNYNYRSLAVLTRRADLLLLAQLGIQAQSAWDIIDHVRRVLSINEHAGEKAIPLEVKAIYAPKPYDSAEEQRTLAAVDHALAEYYGFTDEELDFIINYDIKYRMGAESGENGNGNGDDGSGNGEE